MAQDALSKLLSSRDWLMADGATGTNLFNLGLSSGEPPEFWNTDEPDNIRSLYRSAVEAGSDIFLTNSFGGNAARLKLHSAQGRVRELNKVAAALGREIADASGRTEGIFSVSAKVMPVDSGWNTVAPPCLPFRRS